MTRWFRTYLLPGFVFQSIIIAGGYGTGRELVEFFLQYGPAGGLYGMLGPAIIIVSVVSMISFELARITRTYDYRSFLRQLLGRAWFLYEVAYLASIVLILAVIGAAAGTLLVESFGISASFGTIGLLIAIAFLTYKGTQVIEGFLSLWSFVLYAIYLTLFAVSIAKFGTVIEASLEASVFHNGWWQSGFRYGALQVSLIPAILFATRHITRRKESFIAGALVGPIAILPGVLFFVAMLGHYPDILDSPVPSNYMLRMIDSRTLQIVFQIVLIGTFVETGSGMIHAFNERIAGTFEATGRKMPNYMRPVVAISLLLGALLLSGFGLIALIGKGYVAFSWLFFGIFTVPILTIGAYKIFRSEAQAVTE